MQAPAGREHNEARLLRALGVRGLATTIFNYTVGSGIFALPGLAVARLGAAAPLAYLVCMLVMALVLLCLAEAGSRVSVTGGLYAYVDTGLGPLIGFIAGAVLFFTGLFGGAAVAVLFARTVSALLGLSSQAWYVALIVSVVAAFTVVNVRGVRNSARTMEVITVAKIVPLLAFVLVGAAFVQRSNLAWERLPSLSDTLGTAGLVIFAFTGIESALAPSGEVRAPWRTVPRAAFLALAAAGSRQRASVGSDRNALLWAHTNASAAVRGDVAPPPSYGWTAVTSLSVRGSCRDRRLNRREGDRSKARHPAPCL